MGLYLSAHPKWQNGKRYVYYSLAESYREAGKVKKRVIAHVGTLTDEQAQVVRQTLKIKGDSSYQLLTPNDVHCLRSVSYLEVAVFHQLWQTLQFHKVVEAGSGDVALDQLLEILVLNRCCEPKSKLGVTHWYPTTALDRIMGIPAKAVEESRLYRALPSIEAHHIVIEQHLFQKLPQSGPKALYFYDLSSSYFEGEEVLLAAHNGHSKDHRPDRLQVVLGLLLNQQGLPLSWELFPGNQADAPTLKQQLKKMSQRFGIESAILVFDRGFLSALNLELVEVQGYQYVTGLDAPQIELLLTLHPQPWLEKINIHNCETLVSEQPPWQRLTDTQFYLPLGSINHRQTVLLFDTARYQETVYRRQEKIERFQEWVHQHNQWLTSFKKDANKKAIEKDVDNQLEKRHLSQFITYELHEYITENTTFVRRKNNPYPSQGYDKKVRSLQIVVQVNNRHSLDGIFALITSVNSELSPADVIHAYHQKYLIEAAFRSMKSVLKLRPWFVYKDEHVKAHYTICILAYLLEKLLDLKLEEAQLKDHGLTLIKFKQQLKQIQLLDLEVGAQKQTSLQQLPDSLRTTLQRLQLKEKLPLQPL